MRLSLTDYILWLACFLIQLGVVLALFRRGLHKEYSYFYSYTILSLLGTVVLLCLVNSPFYFYAYWVIRFISAVISFAVLYEVFQHLFPPYRALRDASIVLFRCVVLFLVLTSSMWAINSIHPPTADSIFRAVLLADHSISLMQCGLVLFVLLFSAYLGLSRRHVWFGIALGFGLYASVHTLVMTAMFHQTIVEMRVLSRINSAAGVVAALVWLGYTVLASSRTVPATMRSQDLDSALKDARNSAR
jgi:hypothetical protein